ncbi:MAG: hypothetical protein U1C73_10510, partial [Dietzia sp.]|nr:hypothetical protein [Dietzia sp.]
MVVASLIALAGLLFWVTHVCWHSATIAREMPSIPRSQRNKRLARWSLSTVASGLMLLSVGSSTTHYAPQAFFLAGDFGLWLYKVGFGIGIL